MKLNFLTNPNLNLQEKMRFFADYFLFVNKYLGQLPEISFDNPHSLADKILFQLENNIKRSSPYVENYFFQLLEFYKNDFVTKEDSLLKLETQFNSYLNLKVKPEKIVWLENNEDFKKNVNDLKIELENKLFEDNFKYLFSKLMCSHTLKAHKAEIEYCTRILVSQFRLNGHSKNSVDTYINRILSTDKFSFPFPVEIARLEDKSNYHKAVDEFLDSRSFKDQFEGLRNLMILPKFKCGYFIYVLENGWLHDDLDKTLKVIFDKVTFIGPFHSLLKKLRSSVKKEDKENCHKVYGKFFGKKKLLAFVKLNFESLDAAKEIGLSIVAKELEELNLYLKANIALNRDHYLFYEDFDKEIWHSKTSILKTKYSHISSHDIDSAKGNSYEVLRTISSNAKEQILFNERTFIKAYSNHDVSSFWHYVENNFWSLNLNTDEVKRKFTKILLNKVNQISDDFLIDMSNIFTPFSTSPESIGLTEADFLMIYEEVGIKHNMNFDISSYKNNIRNVVLKDLITYHKNFNSPRQKEKWRQYFKSLLTELYEFRNTDMHSGRVNEFSRIKLSSILPSLINKARWALINACRDNPTLSFEELIHHLESNN